MTIKVYISPDYSRKPTETGGIRRVVDAQVEHLGKFDVEVVHDPRQADIINNHGGMKVIVPGIPMVHTSHGLYWSRQQWGENYLHVNREVIESMRCSVAHTAPSEWVARAIRRGGYFYPEVVYHGVDAKLFKPSKENGGYVVWAKARADFVSDPNDAMKAAVLLPNRQFVATIGNAFNNFRVIGPQPYDSMARIISEAAVYLSTARETFGIGTLEAMAAGVPVAGWDCGGNSEIIIQGETGYLAPWGDYPALAECIEKCYADRERLSKNCIHDARTRWKWEPRIEQYANIYKRVLAGLHKNEPSVSVIVTAYKLDAYLPQCLDSLTKQSMKDFEVLVVDDAQLQSTQTIVEDFSRRDPRIRYTPTPHNMGLPGARNYGLAEAKGEYIRHLDADDFLNENALEIETNALDQDPSIHIVYGHLELVNEDGSRRIDAAGQVERSGWPGDEFNWFQQMSHLNQLPSTVMARREVYERSGGYRERMRRNEDAEFWCRVTSLGFRAKKVTQAVTIYHRMRNDSKGATEWRDEGKEPDWTAMFPWRQGGTDYETAVALYRKHGNTSVKPHLVPFAAQGQPEGMPSWYVHDFAYPVVSVIVTCGPTHEKYLLDALDSIQAQSFPDWECVVVNDTGKKWDKDIAGAPWAKVIDMGGNTGASKARNEGLKHVRGKYVVWMDADDWWLPWLLEKYVAYAEKNKNGVIFSDLIKCDLVNKKESFSVYRYEEFNCADVVRSMRYPGSSVLVPMSIAKAVVNSQGGFSEDIPGMEDWDYQMAVHALGFCAYRVPEPLFIYRTYSSTKREKDYNHIEDIKSWIDNKWSKYRVGGMPMGCGCGAKSNPNNIPASIMSSSGNFTDESLNELMKKPENANLMVELSYNGPIPETFSIRSRVNPQVVYRFGNNEYDKIKAVFLADAAWLTGIVDGNNAPMYRVVSTGGTMEQHDPAAVIGQSIAVEVV